MKLRKLGLRRKERIKLLNNLARSFAICGSIKVTLARAKNLKSYFCRLITLARKGHFSYLKSVVGENVPLLKIAEVQKVCLRRELSRKGDSSLMARVSLRY